MGAKAHLVGERFGKLTVIEELPERSSNGSVKWLCRCDCGADRVAITDYLRRELTISCGCANGVSDDEMVGRKFSRLLVIRRAEPDGDQARWECLCDCGNIVLVRGGNLRNGNSRSCGCGRALAHTTHGKSRTPEYGVWASMKARCLNPKDKAYRWYGGRGITVAEEWIESFEAFLRDVGERPGPTYSIDRIDCNGNYEPGNVRWASTAEQAINKEFRHLTFARYQEETHKTAIYPDDTQLDAVVYCALGLASEAAEVAGKVKKAMRDGGGELTAERRRELIAEIGDTCWYLSELCTSLDVELATAAQGNLNKLADRAERGVLRGSGDKR